MKKSWILAVLFLGLMTVGTAAQEIKWQPAPKTIDIGVVEELTGLSAMTGYTTKCMHEVAVDRVNKEGGINGIPIRVIYEDCKGTSPGGIAAANKLIYQDKVLAIFMTWRPTITLAMHPVVEEAKIPGIYRGTAWSQRELKCPWMFGLRPATPEVSRIMAKFVVEDLGHKKIAGLYSDEEFGEDATQQTLKALKEMYGITPVTVQRHSVGTKDYTAQLLAIKGSGATCIFSWSTASEDAGIILRQVKQLGLNVDFVGGASFGSLDTTVKIAGKDADGIYCIIDVSPVDPSPNVQWLVKETERLFNLRGAVNMLAYDEILVLADAMRRAGIVKEINGKKMIMPLEQARQAIRDALAQTRNFGPEKGALKVYSCDEWNGLCHGMTIVRIKDGQHEIIAKVEGPA